MRSITKTAENKETAIKLALNELNLTEEEVVIEVLEEAKKGFMGMFSKPYTVKVTEKVPENNTSKSEPVVNTTNEQCENKDLTEYEKQVVDKVKDYLVNITTAMEINITDFNVKKTSRGIVLDLNDDNKGYIIGKRGELLDSFDYLVNIFANNNVNNEYTKIILDSNNYRDKREKSLRDFSRKMGLSAIKTARQKTLEPMKPYDRRIVHSVIQELSGVESFSVGKEPYRKVVIKPDNCRDRGYSRKKDNFKPRRTKEENTQFVKASVDSTVKLKIFDETHKSKPLYSKIDVNELNKD